jgi:HEAT repeat protein
VTRFLTAEPLDLPLLDRVIALSGIAAAVPLLDALAVAESRSTRRHLVNRLIAMGETITPDLIARLSDSRWYVVRNLLSVLDTLPALPPEFDVNSFTSYPDPRVRRLALKMQIAVPGARERGLATALNDADPEIVMLGLLGLGNEIPRSLEQRVEQLATDGAASPETREHAIRTLGYCRSEGALAALLAFVDGGRTFFGKQRLAPKSPEMLAALRALASGWSSRPAASRVLERASFSSDAAIRAAASMAGER